MKASRMRWQRFRRHVSPGAARSPAPASTSCRCSKSFARRSRPPGPDSLRSLQSPAMAKTWQDVFLTGYGATPAVAEDAEPEQRRGFLRRLRENLSKSREALSGELRATFTGPLDDETWERLEETLIYADVGARTTAKVVERLEREAEEGRLEGGQELSQRLQETLAELARTGDDHIDVSHEPSVILTVGVNGTGKTTTIGKVAWHLRKEAGLSVVMAAADTYRAAAQEQLAEWATRAECDIVSATPGSDPGAVVYDAIEAARTRGH